MISLYVKSNLKNILNILLVISLFTWAVTVSTKLISAETKVLVIKTNDKGTDVITEDSLEDRTQQDILNLINMFVLTYFSYNQLSFDEQKKQALELLSERLFKEELSKAIGEKKELEGRTFSQEAIIIKVDQLGHNTLEIEISKTILENGKTHTVLSTVILELKPIKRVKENPYGFEIITFKEKKRF